MIFSLSASRNRVLRCVCNAAFSRRSRLRRVISATILPGAALVLLRIEILFLAGQRGRLAQLEAGVHAEQPRQRRRQHRADAEARSAGCLQEDRVDVGRVHEEVRAIELARRHGRQLDDIVDQLGLAVAPGEIGVALRETDLCEPVHHRRPGERLGQEDHLGMAGAHVGDHPFPEGQGLGVRVVDAERPDAMAHPQLDHVAQAQPQVGHRVRAVKVDVDDILILLGRVLRIFHRPVGSPREPARMFGQPGVVGRRLDREVQRDLQALCGRGGDEPVEVGEAAERGVDRIMPAIGRADRIGAADVVGPRS